MIASETFSSKSMENVGHLESGQVELSDLLEETRQQIADAVSPSAVTEYLAGSLHRLRRRLHPNVWQSLAPSVWQHEIFNYFLQDPLTRWSFEKPRGYSGDARLLDFIYGHPDVAKDIENSSALGRELYNHTSMVASSVAVRERCSLVTRYVDEIASQCGTNAEILTIAAGHLREAQLSTSLASGKIKRWVALDQDNKSVEMIAKSYPGTVVKATEGTVRNLITRPKQHGFFDFIYASGLYDYLSDRVAIKLTRVCLSLLKPGGTFMFANFSTDTHSDGYMETLMNWALLWRNEQSMWKIINESIDDDAYQTRVEFGENRNVLYGFIEKSR
ncbi:class I SAM-dependent methyltransferase [Brucella sp. NM4]|uniref:class I SAM-dependent methyltransferase n=1 Tax=Brucella/Ochrobactrum group TaxID=2826938 RepID=UPI0024BCD42D|nr:class I SAM-dependent methyltransferase [Brucella sp. NM4]WHS30640.1 class I SAM-dependent methyltransferase [Brucella sp. NM4]WHT45376.1 class I SAM-dependent methyltransferase [Ochrobactrum sp. SSR]